MSHLDLSWVSPGIHLYFSWIFSRFLLLVCPKSLLEFISISPEFPPDFCLVSSRTEQKERSQRSKPASKVNIDRNFVSPMLFFHFTSFTTDISMFSPTSCPTPGHRVQLIHLVLSWCLWKTGFKDVIWITIN